MQFSYAVPARRFYGARPIDAYGERYEPGRSLVHNAGVLAGAEWGPTRAARAERLAQLVTTAEPTATDAPHARQWAAAILCDVADDDAVPTLVLIENRTGVSPAETAARHHDLTTLLSDRAESADAGAC